MDTRKSVLLATTFFEGIAVSQNGRWLKKWGNVVSRNRRGLKNLRWLQFLKRYSQIRL